MFVVILDGGSHSGFVPCAKAALDLERIERGVSVVGVVVANNLAIASKVVPLGFAFQIGAFRLISVNFAKGFYICLALDPIEALRSFCDSDLGAVFVRRTWSNVKMIKHGFGSPKGAGIGNP